MKDKRKLLIIGMNISPDSAIKQMYYHNLAPKFHMESPFVTVKSDQKGYTRDFMLPPSKVYSNKDYLNLDFK